MKKDMRRQIKNNITAFEWINHLIKSENLYENSLFEARGVSPLEDENREIEAKELVLESGTENIEKSVLKKRIKNNEEAKARRLDPNIKAKLNQKAKEWREDHQDYEKQRKEEFPEYEKARRNVDYLRNLQKKGTKRRNPVTDEEIQKAIEKRTNLRPKTASNFHIIDDSEKIWYDEINKVISRADSVIKIMRGLAKIAKNLNAALKEEDNPFYKEKFNLLVNLLNKAKNNNAVKFDTYDEKVCLDMATIDKLGDSSKYFIPKEFSKYKRFSKIISINQIGKGEKNSLERNERNELREKEIAYLKKKEKSYLESSSKEDEKIANSVLTIDEIIKIVDQKISKYKKIQDELLPKFKKQGIPTNDMVFKKKLNNFIKLKKEINNNIDLLKKYNQIRFDLYSIDRDTNAKKKALRNLDPSSEEYKKIATDDRKGAKKIGKRNSTVPALSMLLRKDYYDKRAREQKLKRIQANKEELKQYIKKMNSEKLSSDEKEDLKSKIKKIESHIKQMESKLNTNESCMNTKEIINFINEAMIGKKIIEEIKMKIKEQ
jgi:hypothetical protein